MENDQPVLEDWELLDALSEIESHFNSRVSGTSVLLDSEARLMRFRMADGRRTAIGFETFAQLLRHTRDFCQACHQAQVRDLDLTRLPELRLACALCEAVHVVIADKLYLTDE